MKLLLKQFPDIHRLPRQEQERLLQEAQRQLSQPENKLARWRHNLLRFSLVAGFCVLLVAWVGPWLGLSDRSTALIMLLVVLPVLFYLQHRSYIARLRPLVKALAEKKAAP